MRHLDKLHKIPKGNTCRGVNRAIIEYLIGLQLKFDGKYLLDIPCGEGLFIKALQEFFPKAIVKGCDIIHPKNLSEDEFTTVDASRPFSVYSQIEFALITSISGVMEFDNTLQFFESCRDHLQEGGLFIVTNDNLGSIRDRLLYLFLGKVRRYPLFVTRGQPSWKIIPIQNMFRILQDAGFKIIMVKYVSLHLKDWLMLPLGVLLYPILLLYLYLKKTEIPLSVRREMFPFASLLCRHYIIACQKFPA